MQLHQEAVLDSLLGGDLFHAIGMDNLAVEKKAELLATMTETVMARALMQAYQELSEADQEVLKSVSEEGLMDFFQEKGIDFSVILMEQAAIHRAEVVSVYRTVTLPPSIQVAV